jgi:hypothetical protein
MAATGVLRWRNGVGWGLFFGAGFFVIGYWTTVGTVELLVFWPPILYGLAVLISGKREIVERLRASPLWFAVSNPRTYEHAFGYGRIFKWSEGLVRAHASQDYGGDDPYYFNIGSGRSWFSMDDIGRQVDFALGVQENILEVPPSEARSLSAVCREFENAASKCDEYLVIGWLLVVAMCFFLEPRAILLLLGICTSIVVWWGVLPAGRSVTARRTKNSSVRPTSTSTDTGPATGITKSPTTVFAGKLRRRETRGLRTPENHRTQVRWRSRLVS